MGVRTRWSIWGLLLCTKLSYHLRQQIRGCLRADAALLCKKQLQNNALERTDAGMTNKHLSSKPKSCGRRTVSSVYAAKGVACVAVMATSELFMACPPARSTSSAYNHNQQPLHAQPPSLLLPSLLHLRLREQHSE